MSVCSNCKCKDASKLCSACQDEWYCSQKCQLEQWSTHKPLCKKYDPQVLCYQISHNLIQRIKTEEKCRLTFISFTRGKYAMILRFHNVREAEDMMNNGTLNRAAFVDKKEQLAENLLRNYDPEKQFGIVIEVKVPLREATFAQFAFAMGIKEEDDFTNKNLN